MRILIAVSLLLIFVSGCGNFSPRGDIKDEINNQGGQIDDLNQELKNLQNSINAEIGNIRTNAENIENMQNGLINQNNSGVQILQGDGALIMVFAVAVIFLVLVFYYRDKQKKSEKATEVLAEEITKLNNLDLEDHIFMVAMARGVEEPVLRAMTKQQRRYGLFR
jgi:predicted PurR-regulated permease PerM